MKTLDTVVLQPDFNRYRQPNASQFCREACARSSQLELRRNPHTTMVIKEETFLLPTAMTMPSSVRQGNVLIKRSFLWLQLSALALMFGWLALLSVITMLNSQPVEPEDFAVKLFRSQEV